MIHCKTRKRDLVDTFFKLGLSASYDKVLEISNSMANDACRRYIQEGIVCPTHSLQNVLISSAVDNIVLNPSSISSKDSFHGTAVLRFCEPDIPLVEGELSIHMFSFPVALKGEVKWLKYVADNSSGKAEVRTNISWSAYHASSLPDGNKLSAMSASSTSASRAS
ncbi:unnamed protein product [Mytilus coruscus]|uniref:Uncharacterized protein n=1 Tax=Mytilus coruscus TaxID=42192 RepID=A0A6J8D1Y9_MYTCO|nr:unnamed protein product [Mytilus coruscus]